MAINPNEKNKNRHTVLVSTSGGGKTWTVKKMIKAKPAANLLIFDPIEVYTDVVKYIDSIPELAEKVAEAITNNEKFRFAYRGSPDTFDRFCEVVWLAADGHKELVVVLEECGGYLNNSAKPSARWYDIITIGRKYGLILFAVAQRPQNINKVVYDESPYIWIGFCKGKAGQYIESEFGCDLSKITFESYSYYLSDNEGLKLFDKNDKRIMKRTKQAK